MALNRAQKKELSMAVQVEIVESGTEPASLNDSATSFCASPRRVLCSKYVVSSVIFNTVGSAAGPLLVMWLVFAVAGQGPYSWNSAAVLGIVFASPFVSATLCNLLVPTVALEMVRRRWFFIIKKEDRARGRLAYVFPFLGIHPIWQIGIVRYLAIGFEVGIVFWPMGVLVVRYGFRPSLSTWTHIGSAVTYCVLIAPFVTLLGMLSWAVDPNFNRIELGCSQDRNCIVRSWRRLLLSLRLLF